MSKHFRIPGRLPLRLTELAVPIAAVLRQAGLPRDLFEQSRILVSTSELFALWRSIDRVTADPFIGIKLGVEDKTERFHPMAIAALSTSNFVEAIQHLARFKKLTAPEEILFDLNEDAFRVAYRWLLALDDEPFALTDYCFAWTLSLARHGTGRKLSPLRVEYVRPRNNAKTLERHFGCEVVTGSAQNAIVFRADDAVAPFVTRNADLFEMLAPQFEQQLQQYSDEDSFIELVRRTIQDRLTGHRPPVETIALALHMSPRTLQRRLREAGSSYQRVLDEARHAMARYYLSNSSVELNEAAYLLGFENPNSFGRAFRNWEGIPPSDWRETQHKTRIQ